MLFYRFAFSLLLGSFFSGVSLAQSIPDDVQPQLSAQALQYAQALNDSLNFYRSRHKKQQQIARQLAAGSLLSGDRLSYYDPAVIRQMTSPDTADRLIATLLRLRDYDRLVARWGRAVLAAGSLRNARNAGSVWKQVNQVSAEPKNKEWLQELIHRETVRQLILFEQRAHDFSSRHPRTINVVADYCSRFGGSILPDDEAADFRSLKAQQSPIDPTPSVTAGGRLPYTAIGCSYPQNGQYNFYPHELVSQQGYVQLRTLQPELIKADQADLLWMKWKNEAGDIVFTSTHYDISKQLIQYAIPVTFLEPGLTYEFSLVTVDPSDYGKLLNFYSQFPIDELIRNRVRHRELTGRKVPEERFFRGYFRVSRFGQFYVKMDAVRIARAASGANTYTLSSFEPFGPEEITGLNGDQPLAQYRFRVSPNPQGMLDKMYGRDVLTYLSHPSEAYLNYLRREAGPKVDSLIAIEFLPHGERSRHYRRLRYTNDEDRTVSIPQRTHQLPERPDQDVAMRPTVVPDPISETDFRSTTHEPSLDKPQELRFEYSLSAAIARIHPQIVQLIDDRQPEYAALLRQLTELTSDSKDLRYDTKQLANILPGILAEIKDRQVFDLPPEAEATISSSYRLPGMRTRTSETRKSGK